MALTQRAHDLIIDHFVGRNKRTAVDATCGNGHDTTFLVEQGFEHVLAFDIQPRALEATKDRMTSAALTRVSLIHDGHQNMAAYLSGPVDCFMFNLGYLPGSDKSITTHAETSLLALDAAMHRLPEGGLISLMCYPGHKAGAFESEAIQSRLQSLDDNWMVSVHHSQHPKPTSPILFSITRKERKE